jgi:hypothetical protein
MWVLEITKDGKSVTRTYVEFGQLAYDDENFAVVQDLADHDYIRWTDDEEPMPQRKMSKALYPTGSMTRRLEDGTEYTLTIVVAVVAMNELLEQILPIVLLIEFVNVIHPN